MTQITCGRGIHVQVIFQIGLANYMQSTCIKSSFGCLKALRQIIRRWGRKFWSKHICGSQNWVCKTIRRACKNTDAWAPPQSFWYCRPGKGLRTYISPKFPSLQRTLVQGPHFQNHYLRFPSHIVSPHPFHSLSIVQRIPSCSPLSSSIFSPLVLHSTLDLCIPSPLPVQ